MDVPHTFGASEAASQRAIEEVGGADDWVARRHAEIALATAHDADLGLDRSVCLRDVVATLHARADEYPPSIGADGQPMNDGRHLHLTLAADFIARKFGGESIRDQAVRNVDSRYGFTVEHHLEEGDRAGHRAAYDDEEMRLRGDQG